MVRRGNWKIIRGGAEGSNCHGGKRGKLPRGANGGNLQGGQRGRKIAQGGPFAP